MSSTNQRTRKDLHSRMWPHPEITGCLRSDVDMRNDDHIKPKLPEAWRHRTDPTKWVSENFQICRDLIRRRIRHCWINESKQLTRTVCSTGAWENARTSLDLRLRHFHATWSESGCSLSDFEVECKLCEIIGSAACPRASTIKNTGGEVGPCRRGWSTRNLKLCSYAKEGNKCTRDLSKKS